MAPARSCVTNGGPGRTRPNPLDLSSTAEYHHSLRDQSRQREVQHSLEDSHSCNKAAPKSTTWRWMHTRPKTSDSGIRAAKNTVNKRDTIINMPVQLSRQEIEEFETLPIAVRRKYFSTLERLRFAQTSSNLDVSVSSLPDDYNHSPRSFTFSHTRALPNNGLKSKKLSSQSQTSLHHQLDTINSSHRQLSREEQVALVRNLRQSVIMDAADEAIYKIGRRASRHLSPPERYRPASSTDRPSMEARGGRKADSKPREPGGLDAFYDSFKWLDGDDDLDLSLQLDDYHANLKEHLPIPSKDNRPSFRRHLSINKIPFGRSSVSISRPGTNGVLSTPASPSPISTTHPAHARRKSRALSLINTARHIPRVSTASIDPAAAHYQDPEARAKLRVYLASPQKFDEAVEFGFPSGEAPPVRPVQDSYEPRGHSRQLLSQDSSAFRTFFSDDRSSIYSDDDSLPDPESPRTPHSPDKATLRPDRMADSEAAPARKISDNYAQLPAASREMTLRMTLTRPDLRACEDQIYGWQKMPIPQAIKTAQPAPSQDELLPPKAFIADNSKPKESFDAFFASLDEEDETTTESGGFKRFWNKVRRN